MNVVELTILWTDDDGMLQLAVRATSPTHSAYHETYVYPDSLASFAQELREYPRAVGAEVVLECGSKNPKWHDYLRMRIFMLTSTGQSALELESEVRGSAPSRAEAHFFVPGMPADFNRLGAEIVAWLSNPSERFRIEWRNG
jgi:hypothetical protein